MDDKLKKIIFIVLGGFAILFLFIILLSSCSGNKYSPEKLESYIKSSTESYYKSHEDELPSKGGVVTLSIDDLVNKKIIKSLDKLVDDDTNCSGSISIENNNDYFMYSPNLNCTYDGKEYKTEKLVDLLKNNTVTSGNGIYFMNNEYYFRGDNVDNYLVFDNNLWRIVKINNDNSIKLIEDGKRDYVVWDDRYNEELEYSSGISEFVQNGIDSRIKETLNNFYEGTDVFSESGKGFIKETSLCVGKRSDTDTINDGSLECSVKVDNQFVGLLQVNEYLLASLDSNCTSVLSDSCTNYNYLAKMQSAFWTLTASSEKTGYVYKISETPFKTIASNSGTPKIVINISENTLVTGTGTEDDPYLVSGFSKLNEKK